MAQFEYKKTKITACFSHKRLKLGKLHRYFIPESQLSTATHTQLSPSPHSLKSGPPNFHDSKRMTLEDRIKFHPIYRDE